MDNTCWCCRDSSCVRLRAGVLVAASSIRSVHLLFLLLSSVYGGKTKLISSGPPQPPKKLPNIKDNLLFPMLFTSKFRLRQPTDLNNSANSFQISSLIQPFCVVQFITVMRLNFYFFFLDDKNHRGEKQQHPGYRIQQDRNIYVTDGELKFCRHCTKWACKQKFGCVCERILRRSFHCQWHKQHMAS